MAEITGIVEIVESSFVHKEISEITEILFLHREIGEIREILCS